MDARSLTLVATALAVCLLGCSGDKHRRDVQYAQRLAPARIAQPRPGEAPPQVRTLKVRVYADEAYRAQNLRWQEKLEALVGRANRVLRPSFGVELEVASTHLWKREAGDDDLDAMLSELERLDDGRDAAWVIGLVTALPHVTSSLHLLGGARPMGRHMILRGINDTAERKVIERALSTLSDSEREELHGARKSHKELAIFLHEWAHTLGALHTMTPGELMMPTYDASASQFAEQNAEIIRLGLAFRGQADATGQVAARWNAKLREHLEQEQWEGWIEEDYRLLLGLVAQGPQASPEVEVSAELTPRGRRAYYAALDYEKAGRFEEAFREILPLTEQYDREPEVMRLGCRLSARAKGPEFPTLPLCERAAELSPNDAGPMLEVSRAQFAAGDRQAGLEALRAAHERLSAASEPPEEQWLELAAHYQKLGALTWTEQALADVDGGERAASLRTWIGQTRRRYGVEPGAVAPQDEAAYVAAAKEVLSLTYGGQYDAAADKARALRQQYPKAPGADIVMCDLELRRGRAKAARGHCQRAIDRYEQAVWAMYLLASIEAGHRKHGAAIRHLERAIELEPTMQAAWRLLAREYGKTGADAKREQLRKRYKQRFDAEL